MTVKKVWIRSKMDVPEAARAGQFLSKSMESKGFEIVSGAQSQPDLVVCLSGDGTLLATLQELGDWRWKIPVLAIHGSYGLGFMHAISVPKDAGLVQDWSENVARALQGRLYEIENRYGLEAQVSGVEGIEKIWAFNDLVVAKGALSRMVGFQMSVNGHVLLAKARGDGMIFSSANGSTAYSMSAGGPVVDPRLQALVVTPVCLHRMSHRPMVLSHDAQVEVQILESSSSSYLTVDGQQGFELNAGVKVTLSVCKNPIQWVTLKSPDLKPFRFYEVLRDKLGYGG